jgi:hypothetical protein
MDYEFFFLRKENSERGMVEHACNHSTLEAEMVRWPVKVQLVG